MRGEGREEREGRKGGGVGPLSKQREVVRREGQRVQCLHMKGDKGGAKLSRHLKQAIRR